MTSSETLTEFIVNKYLGFTPQKEITENTRIREDLDIEGDDAIDFFEKIENEFNVDFQNLELSKYFHSEGFNPFSFVVNFFSKSKKSLKVSDIAKSIEAKEWIDPE